MASIRNIAAEPEEISFSRVSIYYDSSFDPPSPSIEQIVIERKILHTSKSTRSKLEQFIQDETSGGIAQYIDQQLDAHGLEELFQVKPSGSADHVAEAADSITTLRDSLHELLIGFPAKEILGTSIPKKTVELIPIEKVDKPLSTFRRVIDIGAIVGGVITGNPAMALAGAKAFAHDAVNEAVVDGAKTLIKGILDGDHSKRASYMESTPSTIMETPGVPGRTTSALTRAPVHTPGTIMETPGVPGRTTSALTRAPDIPPVEQPLRRH